MKKNTLKNSAEDKPGVSGESINVYYISAYITERSTLDGGQFI